MGIDANSLRFLAEAVRSGVDFKNTLTIGRQNYYRLSPALLREGLSRAGFKVPPEVAEKMFSSHGGYADELFRFLGATTLDSADYSDYERASFVFDMNRPNPPELNSRFTAVIDGGSLEHIFNFPQAMTNCMNMVAIGGHFIGMTPANNFFGHGFYQFSAELFFRVFDETNGFALERMVLVEDDQCGYEWFSVKDPAVAGERVTLTSAAQSQLFVIARKVAQRFPFLSPPCQSDYVARWAIEGGGSQVVGRQPLTSRLRNLVGECLPRRAKKWLKSRMFPGPRTRPDLFTQIAAESSGSAGRP